MEKKEALREWCVDQAMRSCRAVDGMVNVDEVLKTAKKLEEYVSDTTVFVDKDGNYEDS